MGRTLYAIIGAVSCAVALGGASIVRSQYLSDRVDLSEHLQLFPTQTCIQVSSSGSFPCKDSGGYDSTCAVAKCPDDRTLTGGGGSCSAGDRKIKSLFPRLASGEFTIACEAQGVDPAAVAICCAL